MSLLMAKTFRVGFPLRRLPRLRGGVILAAGAMSGMVARRLWCLRRKSQNLLDVPRRPDDLNRRTAVLFTAYPLLAAFARGWERS